MNTDHAVLSPIKRALPTSEFTGAIISALYAVWNELGYGHRERYYQQAFAKVFEESGLPFEQEKSYPLLFRGKALGHQRLDFLVNDALIVELKVGRVLNANYFAQVLAYLKVTAYPLALIALFAPQGVRVKRIIDSGNATAPSAFIGVSAAQQ